MKRRGFLQFATCVLMVLFAPKIAAKKLAYRVPPKTCDELYAAMNSLLPVGPATERMWSVTGEEYYEHAMGINLRQCIERGLDPEVVACGWAWDVFIKQAMRHDMDLANIPKDTKLYWRIKPEFTIYQNQTSYAPDWDGSMEETKARIYMRYLISSQPQVSRGGDIRVEPANA